jgi:hypothetical protein
MVCRMNMVPLRPEVSTTLSVGSKQYLPVYWPVCYSHFTSSTSNSGAANHQDTLFSLQTFFEVAIIFL